MLVVVGLVTAGCTVGRGTGVSPPPAPRAQSATLVAYNGCSDLLARVKAEALTEVGQYGSVPSTMAGRADIANGQATAGAAASSAAVAGRAEPAVPGAPGATGYSTTNNQEAGADEPDLAKTNGRLMVVVRHQPYGIQVVDVASSRPRLAG